MKDAQGEPAYGRTNWRRFAIAVGVPAVATVGLVVGLANGAFAASLTLSGQSFKLSADKLVGDSFAQYSEVMHDAKGKPIPLAVSGIGHATLTNMCQSVRPPNSPISLIIRAGRDPQRPAEADNLLIGMTELSGTAKFDNIDIGVDASKLSEGGNKVHGAVGGFAQQATKVTIDGLKQTAYSTQAGSFTLNGLSLKLSIQTRDRDAEECYPG